MFPSHLNIIVSINDNLILQKHDKGFVQYSLKSIVVKSPAFYTYVMNFYFLVWRISETASCAYFTQHGHGARGRRLGRSR